MPQTPDIVMTSLGQTGPIGKIATPTKADTTLLEEAQRGRAEVNRAACIRVYEALSTRLCRLDQLSNAAARVGRYQ